MAALDRLSRHCRRITYINVRGIQLVGKFATALELFILLPVLVLVVIGLAHWHHNPFVPVVPPHQPAFPASPASVWQLGCGSLPARNSSPPSPKKWTTRGAVIPWRWPSSCPCRSPPIFCQRWLARRPLGNWGNWHTGYFPHRRTTYCRPLAGADHPRRHDHPGRAVNGTILASTRMPFAMAEDGYLPHVLTGVHPRYGMPWTAIITSAAIYALLAIHSLLQLIAIYNWSASPPR